MSSFDRQEALKDIQTTQLKELLDFLPSSEVLAVAHRLNMVATDKKSAMPLLLSLAPHRVIERVPKNFLAMYIGKLGLSHCSYVSQMRSAIVEHWEKERLDRVLEQQNARNSQPSSPAPRKPTPSTSVVIDLSDHEDPPPSPSSDTNTQLATRDSHNSLSASPKSAGSLQPSSQFPPQGASLGGDFCKLFYTLLHGPNPQEILSRGLFSAQASAYLFLFSPDGMRCVGERKASGLKEISVLLQLLAHFRFSYGSHEEEQDQYGSFSVKSFGNIVSADGETSMGLFTHFFTFFRSEGNYLLREASFHCRTHPNYQPLSSTSLRAQINWK